MLHNVCLIDDQIPLDKDNIIEDTKRLNSSSLKFLLNEDDTEWSESTIKDLLSTLITDKLHWNVSAFKYPDFYLTSIDEENYLADFIIFDWDFGLRKELTEDFLKQIIQKNFAVVIIFTASDKKDIVEEIIDRDFSEYKNRIDIIVKSETDSIQKLINKANELFEKNFAFKFCHELRRYSSESLESILVELGKPDIKELVLLFGNEREGQCYLDIKDLTEIIVEKLRNQLISKKFGENIQSVNKSEMHNLESELTRKLWSYRMYFSPTDELVRQGDIIKKKDSLNDELYLVISSDCHLKEFWKKNSGYLTIIPLHIINKTNRSLHEKLIFSANSPENIYATSLINTKGISEGPTVISSIPINSVIEDYFLFPKNISSVFIELPKDEKKNTALLYKHMKDYDWENRVCLSEPFKTPLIEHILYNITGYGAPDYPTNMQTNIKNIFKDIFSK